MTTWEKIEREQQGCLVDVTWRVAGERDTIQVVRGTVHWPPHMTHPILKESSFSFEPPAVANVKFLTEGTGGQDAAG